MSQLEFNTYTETDERETIFVDVILPVPIPRMFTYRVPFNLNDKVASGCRVIVQFGPRKILTGVIGRLHNEPPAKYEAKYLLELLDDSPVVHSIQIEMFQWMASYYMCTIGEVFNIAIPSGLKLSSESKIQLHPEFDFYESPYEFDDNEELILDTLKNNTSLSYTEVSKILGIKGIYSLIKSLVAKDAVLIFEEIKEKYKPKKEKRIRLAAPFSGSKSELERLFDNLSAKPKQEAIILQYLQEVPVYKDSNLNEKGLLKSSLSTPDLSLSSLNTLIKNSVLEEFEVIVSRFKEYENDLKEINLTDYQEQVKDEIISSFQNFNTVLLHGITGSGKTEIYIKLIQDTLSSGSQALYLLPEIALTTQIVGRLRKAFGDKMGVYHSKFSDNERVEVWKGVLSGQYQFVVGVRSSIFLPFDNLGLIVVDEEHESSYKQYDPAPRYHARDVAIVLGAKHHSKVLLGSATPSMESYYQAQSGKYGLVCMDQRYGKAQLPEFEIADMIRERKRKTLKGEFSSILVQAIKERLEKKEQAIIFQNRRGYSPYVSCMECGWIPQCNNCSVSLTYHQYRQEILCHYCGYKEPLPRTCEACGSTNLKTMGFGTEKLEEDLELLFPSARVQRMDLDTTRKKTSYERIISDFENGDIDILVGTQMVSKGLDFDHVSLVGIFDIDRMMFFPDFRSFERTFQLATQVSGRAGRRNKTGKVIIQTRNTDQSLLRKIISNDFEAFYQDELKERETYLYPPFARLIQVTVKNKDVKLAQLTSQKLTNLLREQLGASRVLGPEAPLIL
ncbi:MAG: primosomal protein N' [Bacteroidota bacterium]